MEIVSLFDRGPDQGEFFLKTAINNAQLAMIATDHRLKNQPIIFANKAFEKLTGYSNEEILGRNCNFLQGENTSVITINAIRQAIENGQEGYFEILNYKKDGTPFWNALHIGPVKDPSGDTSLFFGSQRDVTNEVEARQFETTRMKELRHSMGNLMAVVGMIVRNTNEGDDVQSMRKILHERIAALGAATELIYPKMDDSRAITAQSLNPKVVPFERVFSTIIKPLGCDHQFETSGPSVSLAEKEVTNLSLVLHELCTNALKHGALSHPAGKIYLTWKVADGRMQLDWLETGRIVEEKPHRKGMGMRLLESMVSSSQRPDAAFSFEMTGVIYRFDIATPKNV